MQKHKSSNGAQVFIATTKGLVQIQSITALANSDLASVMTIDRTVNTTGVSGDYALFVDSTQGIIKRWFGGSAYRLNVSAAIDVGNSWQLGVFLAHGLANINKLVEHGGDEIFIVTGAIDTENHLVMGVADLSRKCLAAKTHIENWQAKGFNVHFLIPSDNFRQPLPDINVLLRPIASLEQLSTFLSTDDASNQQNDVALISEAIDTTYELAQQHADKSTPIHGAQKNKPVFDSTKADANVLNTQKHYALSKLSKGILGFATILALAIIALLYYKHLFNEPEHSQYRMYVNLSENKADCGFAAKHVIGEGELLIFNNIQAQQIRHVCSMQIATSLNIASVWLVSEDLQINALQPKHKTLSTTDLPQIWDIPNVQNPPRAKSQLLLLFTHDTDLADQQNLQYYLRNQSQSTQLMMLNSYSNNILIWANKLGYKVYIVQQNFAH